MSIDIPFNKIALFCSKWQVCEFSLFGSVLRDDFNATSDIDVLVSFSKEAHPTLFTLARMRNELIQIFGREVDLVTKRGMEMSRNYIRKKKILDSAKTIYVA